MRAENPLLNPAKTGNPKRPANIYTTMEKKAHFAGSVVEINAIANTDNVTGIVPMGIIITDDMHSIAAKRPLKIKSFVFIILKKGQFL